MYAVTTETLDAVLPYMEWLADHAAAPLLEKYREGVVRGLDPLCAYDCILSVALGRGELPDTLANVCRSIPPERWKKVPKAAFLLGQDFVATRPPGGNPPCGGMT